MTGKAKFMSDAFAAIHGAAPGLHRAGAIEKATMRDLDAYCLVAPIKIAPQEIERTRDGARVSQPMFAHGLRISESTVQKWEAGTKRPSGILLKLLAVVETHGLKVLA